MTYVSVFCIQQGRGTLEIGVHDQNQIFVSRYTDTWDDMETMETIIWLN